MKHNLARTVAKVASSTTFTLILFLTSGNQILAQNEQAGQIVSPTNITIPRLVRGITNIIPAIIVVTFLGFLIYGGFVRITAGGNEENMQKSNQILISAIVGFVIIVLSALIVNLIGIALGTGPLINL